MGVKFDAYLQRFTKSRPGPLPEEASDGDQEEAEEDCVWQLRPSLDLSRRLSRRRFKSCPGFEAIGAPFLGGADDGT